VYEISYHLAVRASQNWSSGIILMSLKMYAYRGSLGAFEVRNCSEARQTYQKKKNMYLGDSMDLKISGVRFHVACYVPPLFTIQNFYTLPAVWIYGPV